MNDPTSAVSRADDLANRALELAARVHSLIEWGDSAPELDEDLAKLEAELAALDAEEARLDQGIDPDEGAEPLHAADDADDRPDWVGTVGHWAETMAEGLAERMTSWANDLVATRTDPGESFELFEPTNGPVRVQVENRTGGAIRVIPGSTDGVRVRSRRKVGTATVTVERSRSGDVVVSARRLRGVTRPNVPLTVLVPVGSPLRVEGSGGRVEATGTEAEVQVRTGGGSVRVIGGRGSVTAITGGGTVRLHDIDGQGVVRTGGGTIHVNGRLRGDSNLGTGGGSVTVALRPGTNLRIDGRGSSATSNIPGISVSRARLQGKTGSGRDGSLVIRTGGGAVRVVEG